MKSAVFTTAASSALLVAATQAYYADKLENLISLQQQVANNSLDQI